MTASASAEDALRVGLDNHRLVQQCLRDNARRFPDKVHIHAIDQDKAITWSETWRLCNRFARWLEDKGIGADDRVVVLSDNVVEPLLLFLGIMRRGATVCPIDFDSSAAQTAELLDRLQPRLVLWHRSLDPDALGVGSPGEWVPFGEWHAENEAGPDETDELFSILRTLADLPEAPYVGRPDATSIIGFTSGTSSAPKGVIHRYDNYALIGKSATDLWSVTADDRLLEYRSFAWASTHTLSLMPSLLTGATVIMARKFSHSRFFEWIREHRPTVVLGIPTVVNMFLNRRVEVGDDSLSSVRFMSCSTAPLHTDQLKQFEEAYGIPLIQHYGATEGGMLTGNRPEERKVGSVGRACKYQEVMIAEESGQHLPPGEIGEICIQGPQICYGYLLGDGTVEKLRGSPFKTGDLGYLDDEGFLHITGRRKDTIIRGGLKIAPLEIDEVLMDHACVAEAAAVGVPDKVYGEDIVAFVACKQDSERSAEAVRAHCATRLPEFKCPREIVFVDSIPKTDRGKVDRPALLADWMRERGAN